MARVLQLQHQKKPKPPAEIAYHILNCLILRIFLQNPDLQNPWHAIWIKERHAGKKPQQGIPAGRGTLLRRSGFAPFRGGA
jgi:hypothetical protein